VHQVGFSLHDYIRAARSTKHNTSDFLCIEHHFRNSGEVYFLSEVPGDLSI